MEQTGFIPTAYGKKNGKKKHIFEAMHNGWPLNKSIL